MKTLLMLAAFGAALVSSSLYAAAPDMPSVATCRAGLDRTLAVMEAKPLMREEEATGLMWLRLDAHVALEKGDVATCMEKLSVVEIILGEAGPDHRSVD